MDFGLSENSKCILISIFEKYLTTGEVFVYGSRAKGNFTSRSDIDLVIKNNGNKNAEILANIKDAVEESDFPYLIDIQFFEEINNTNLIEHINRVGKSFYKTT